MKYFCEAVIRKLVKIKSTPFQRAVLNILIKIEDALLRFKLIRIKVNKK